MNKLSQNQFEQLEVFILYIWYIERQIGRYLVPSYDKHT